MTATLLRLDLNVTAAQHSRVVSHDVAHVHLDGELLQVDGKHHQSLPGRPLLAGCLSILTDGGS